MTSPAAGSDERDLLAAIRALLSGGPVARLRWGGKVTQVAPLRVDVGGTGVGVPCARLTSYSPAIGQSVVLIQQGGQYLCLGAFTPSA